MFLIKVDKSLYDYKKIPLTNMGICIYVTTKIVYFFFN